MSARAIKRRAHRRLGNWIRFKNRWDLWDMDAAPVFACMEDAIAFLQGLRRNDAQTMGAALEAAPEPA
ncbi:hypothetical protein [Delftia tsuruhatensis]|uniref:hypothetical protein n=1 Tax=Delftia tsuruhatensis TaxID=180282 RepID=UPI003A89F5A3